MKAYWFKFDQGKSESGHKYWIGLAVGKTMNDIFWTVDEHGNPNEAFYIKAEIGSFCHGYDESKDDRFSFEHEGSDFSPFVDDERWKAITFDLGAAYEGRN